MCSRWDNDNGDYDRDFLAYEQDQSMRVQDGSLYTAGQEEKDSSATSSSFTETVE